MYRLVVDCCWYRYICHFTCSTLWVLHSPPDGAVIVTRICRCHDSHSLAVLPGNVDIPGVSWPNVVACASLHLLLLQLLFEHLHLLGNTGAVRSQGSCGCNPIFEQVGEKLGAGIKIVAKQLISLPNKRCSKLNYNVIGNPIGGWSILMCCVEVQSVVSGICKYPVLVTPFGWLLCMYWQNLVRALLLTIRSSTASCVSGWYRARHFGLILLWRG